MRKVSLWRLFGVGFMSALIGLGSVAHAAPKLSAEQYRALLESYKAEAESLRAFMDSYNAHVEVWGDPELYTPFTNKLYVNITDNLKRQSASFLEVYARVDKIHHADAVTVWARKGFPQKTVKNGSVPDVQYFKDVSKGKFASMREDAISRASARNPDIAASETQVYEGLYDALDQKLSDFHATFSELVNQLVQLSPEAGGPGAAPTDGVSHSEYKLQGRAGSVIRDYERLRLINKHLADGSIAQTGFDSDVVLPRYTSLKVDDIRNISNGDFTSLNNAVDVSVRILRAQAHQAAAGEEPDPPTLDSWFTRYYEDIASLKEVESELVDFFRENGTDIASLPESVQEAHGELETRRAAAADAAAGDLDKVSDFYPALSDSLQMVSGVSKAALEERSVFNPTGADYLKTRAMFTSRDFSDLKEGEALKVLEQSVEKAYTEAIKASTELLGLGRDVSTLNEAQLTEYNKIQFSLYKKRLKFQELFSQFNRASEERATQWLGGKAESNPVELARASYTKANITGRYPSTFSQERIQNIATERSTIDAGLSSLGRIFDQMKEIKEIHDPLFQKNGMLQFEGKQVPPDNVTVLANLKRNFGVLQARANDQDTVIQRSIANLYKKDVEGGGVVWNKTSQIEWPRLDEQLKLTAQGNRPPPLRPKPAVPKRPVGATKPAVEPPARPVDTSGVPLPAGDRELPSRSQSDLSRIIDRWVTDVQNAGSVRYSRLLDSQDSVNREVDLRALEDKFRALEGAEVEMRTYFRHNALNISRNPEGNLADSFREKIQRFNDLADETETGVSDFLGRFADEHNFADLYDVGLGSLKLHYRYSADGASGVPTPNKRLMSPSEYGVSPRTGSSATSGDVQSARDILRAKITEAETSVTNALSNSERILEIYTRKNELSLDQINSRVDAYNSGVREVLSNRQRLFVHMDDLAKIDANVLDFVAQEDLVKSPAIWKQMPTVDEMLKDSYDVSFESILQEKGSAGISSEFRLPATSSEGAGYAPVAGALEGAYGGHWFGSAGNDAELEGKQLITKEFGDLLDSMVETKDAMDVQLHILSGDDTDTRVDPGANFVRRAWNEERFKLEFVYKARLARLMNHSARSSPHFRDSNGKLDVRKLGGLLSELIEKQPAGARAFLLRQVGFQPVEPGWSGPTFSVHTGSATYQRVSTFKFGEISAQSEPLPMPDEEFVSHDIVQARAGYARDREIYISAIEYWLGEGEEQLKDPNALISARDDVSTAKSNYLDARRRLFSLDPNGAVWAEHKGNATELPPHSDVDEAVFASRGEMAELAALEPNVNTPNLVRIEADVVSTGAISKKIVRFQPGRSSARDRIRRSMVFAEEETPSDPAYFLANDPRHQAGDDVPGASVSDLYAQVNRNRGVGGSTATGGRADAPYAQVNKNRKRPPALPEADESDPYATPGSGGGHSGPGYHVLNPDGGSSVDENPYADPDNIGGGGSDPEDFDPYELVAVNPTEARELGLDAFGRPVDPVLGPPPVGPRPDVVRPPVPPRSDVVRPPVPPRQGASAPSGGARPGASYERSAVGIEEVFRAIASMDVDMIAEYRSAALERLIESYRGSYYMKDGSAENLGLPSKMPEFGKMASKGYKRYLKDLAWPEWTDQSSILQNAFIEYEQFDQEVANSPPSADANAPDRFYAYSSSDSPRAAWRASPRFGDDIGIGDTFVSADTMIVDNSPFGAASASLEAFGGVSHGSGKLVVYEILNEDFGQFDRVSGTRATALSKWGLKKKVTINPNELGGGVARSLGEKLARLRAIGHPGGFPVNQSNISHLKGARGKASKVSEVFDSIQNGTFKGQNNASTGPVRNMQLERTPKAAFGSAVVKELAFVGVDKSAFTRGTAFEVVDIQDKRIRYRFYRKPLQGTDEVQSVLGGREGLVGFNEVLQVKRVVLRPRSSVNSGEEVWVSRNRGTEGPRLVSVDSQWEDLDALGVKKGFAVQCE